VPTHLTDLACLEWIRFGRVELAPEASSGVATHLESCAECRARVVDFQALEKSFLPYGTPMPVPRRVRFGRVLVAALVVAAVMLGIALVVAIAR
jgi:hypothetical protein